MGNAYIDGKTNTTVRGQTELDVLSLGQLGLYMEDVFGVYPNTNLVLTFDGTITDQGWPRLRALPIEQMILNTLSAGQVLGTSAGKKPAAITQSAYLSGLDSPAVSANTLATSSNALAAAALQKSGGTMTGNITLAGTPTAALHPASKGYTDGLRVDSLAALQAITGSASVPRVDLLGYYAPGDGGGGLLYWTNTITGTNTLTRYAATGGGSWQRLVSKPLNPRWAGMTGDFTTDDAVITTNNAALQACLDWIDPNTSNTNQSMLQICFTDGRYVWKSVTNRVPAEIFGSIRSKSVFSTSAPGLYQSKLATGPLIYDHSARIIVHGLNFFGRASSSLRNTNTIATVTDRFNFAVSSTNSVPTSILSSFPYGGVCLFYKPVGAANLLVGSGVISAVSGGTNITLASNYDWYATDTASNLSTGWTVCFSPWSTWTNAYNQSPNGPASTNFYAPACGEIGNAAITLYKSQNCIIEDCNISGFSTGIHLKGCAVDNVSKIQFYACHLADVWGDNLFDSTLDSIAPQLQQLFNGTFPNEYTGIDGNGVLFQAPAVASTPTTDTFYCQGRSTVGGWGWNNNIGNHWVTDYGAVGVNLSGQAGYNMVMLADATMDNSGREAIVLDGSGYLKWDMLSHSSVSGVALASSGFPVIRTLNKSFFDGIGMEINKVGSTNTYTFIADVTGSTPPTNSSLAGFHLFGNPLTNSNVIYNGAVYSAPSPGTLPIGTLLGADATAALQPTTLQQLGVVGTLATNALPKAGGTISANLAITGTLNTTGLTTSVNTTNTGTLGANGFGNTGALKSTDGSASTINQTTTGVYVGPRTAGDPHDYTVTVATPLLVEAPTGNNNIAVAAFGGSPGFRTLAASGTQASPGAVSAGTAAGEIDFSQFDGTAWATPSRIYTTPSQVQGTSAHGNDLYFETTQNSSATRGTGTMKLLNSGALGFAGAGSDLTSADGQILWRTDLLRFTSHQNGLVYPIKTEPRGTALADAATITPLAGNYDLNTVAALSQTTAIAAPTSDATVGSGFQLTIRIVTASAQVISWNSIYRWSTTTPAVLLTSGSAKADYFVFVYNGGAAKWDIMNANLGH